MKIRNRRGILRAGFFVFLYAYFPKIALTNFITATITAATRLNFANNPKKLHPVMSCMTHIATATTTDTIISLPEILSPRNTSSKPSLTNSYSQYKRIATTKNSIHHICFFSLFLEFRQCYSFLLTTHVCGFIFPSRSLGFLGQLPGAGRPNIFPRTTLAPQYVQVYSILTFSIRFPHFL